ncbi:MAG: FkbM family methyltransferase [Candidatus Nanohaloarchaea archaeon]|nr:FkbM family methyltransferase [Candidatus Nanohaloarchaea archaeon]
MFEPANQSETFWETVYRKSKEYVTEYTLDEVVAELTEEATRRGRLWYHVDEAPEGHRMEVDGVQVTLPEQRHFRELVHPGIITGYTQQYDPSTGDVVIDLGAYPGDFTVYAAEKVGPDGTVIALEPEPHNFAVLEDALSLNGVENVEPVQAAVYSEPGTVTLDKPREYGRIDTEGTIDVEALTLDGLMEQVGVDTVDFVKMDVEGAETAILDSATGILETHAPHVAVASYHPRENGEGPTSVVVEQQLEDHGYTAVTGYPAHLTTWGIADTES